MNPLASYWTVVVPWSPHPTEWHPTDRTGPFATLTRGAFATQEEAITWGREHLDGQPYQVREVESPFTPGIYRLAHDVLNPKGDKRTRHDWALQAIWPKGMRVHVVASRWRGHDGALAAWAGHRSNQRVLLSELPLVLLEALAPATEARDLVDGALEAESLEGWQAEALIRLVERGDVTIEQILTAAHEAADATPEGD